MERNFYVLCKNCKVRDVKDCVYPATNVSIFDTGETIYIRKGSIRYLCLECGEMDACSVETHMCYICNHKTALSAIVMCSECGTYASAIPGIEKLDESKGEQEDCQLSIDCMDLSWHIVLSCGHHCCLTCFCEYCRECAKTQNYIHYDSAHNQYLLSCFADCNQYHSTDYLRLGGENAWGIFTKKNMDALISKQAGGYICPLPNCGGVMMNLPPKEEQPIITCLYCKRQVCRHCDEEAIDGCCPQDGSKDTIDKTCRRCPHCHIPVTHYFGDECHHIGYGMGGCPGCRAKGEVFHWCYYCLAGGPDYPESCRQNHWFCKTNCEVCPPCPICNKRNHTNKKWKCFGHGDLDHL
ncbi:hypothetical protein WA158_008018 [Blastocystis sp. Blastoise]